MARGLVLGVAERPSHIGSSQRRSGPSAPAPLQGLPWRGLRPRVALRSTLGYDPAPLRGLTALGFEARRPYVTGMLRFAPPWATILRRFAA